MGDLFSSFNPQTTVIFSFAGNWVACLSVLIIVPQGGWLSRGQKETLMKINEEKKSVKDFFSTDKKAQAINSLMIKNKIGEY